MKQIQLISASAGSGKTYRLMNEIADRLSGRKGHAPVVPESIMATTFTNKAAAELRERIRMRLLEEGRSADAQRIYDGLIGTVNSICARLLKEYAFEAGLSPAIDVLPEEDAGRIFKMATASAIESTAADIEPIARRLGLMGYGSTYAKQADWRDFVQDIVDLARSNDMDANTLRVSALSSWESLESLLGEAYGEQMGRGEEERLKDAIRKAYDAIEAGEKVNKGAKDSISKLYRKLDKGWELDWVEWMEIESIDIGKRGSDLIKGLWGPWAGEDKAPGLHLKLPSFRNDMRQMIEGVFGCAATALDQYASFKREQGLMDFVDQESLVLKMLRENADFRASIRERVKLLMVDEFQDTSPIQLALFLELSKLAEDVVWVGDQKQAIYGFRGTDPVLMDAVAEAIEEGSVPNPDNVLKESWRSKRELVECCNALFTPVFHRMGAEKVQLGIPEQRQAKAEGGWLEHWQVAGSNTGKRANAFVGGVQALISEKGVSAGDIAILCRSNSECEEVSKSLTAAGIRASIAQGELLGTNECTLTLAALRYLSDPGDTIAMAEVVCFSPFHTGHESWRDALMRSPEVTREAWRDDPLLQALEEAGNRSVYLTPMESLEAAIGAVRLEEAIHAWGDISLRMGNLDQVRAACQTYQDRCKSRRGSATVSGFLTWLYSEAELKQAEGSGPDTVKVLTYHKSKGLEWPVVILRSLNKGARNNLFGVAARPAEQFSADNPLAGRSIHFWPWPYGTKKAAPALMERLEGSLVADERAAEALRESQRVLYVGMTRARDGMVLVQEEDRYGNVASAWLDEMVNADGEPVLSFTEDAVTIAQGDGAFSSFPSTARFLEEQVDESAAPAFSWQPHYVPSASKADVSYPAATCSPSMVQSSTDESEQVVVELAYRLGERLPLNGRVEMAAFGNAMHGFLGADHRGTEPDRLALAESLLNRWGVAGSIDADQLLVSSDRLQKFVSDQWPDGRIMREWPMRMTLPNHQRMNGWIDMLVEMPEGFVIIDHKSYPGADPVEHARDYAPQLAVYKNAVEQATCKPVLQTLIHMPLQGMIIDVALRQGEGNHHE